MAWVKSVTIDGLAGRDYEFTIEFKRDLNVLWGVNGCGKTSLLRIIHSALQDDPQILLNTPFKSAAVVLESNNITYTRSYERAEKNSARSRRQIDAEQGAGDDIAFLSAVEVEFAEMIGEQKTLRWKTVPRRTSSIRRFAHRFLPISRVASDGRTSPRSFSSEGAQVLNDAMIDRHFADEIQRLWREYSIRESHRISNIQREGIAEILNSIVERGDTDSAGPITGESTVSIYGILRSFFESQRIPFELGTQRQFVKSYKSNETLRRVAHKVVEIQSSTMEIGEPRRRAQSLVDELFTGNKRLQLGARAIEVQIHDVTVPVQHLSSGEKQLLRMLIESLTVGSNCILIDEPELSMHVDWQNRLINAMRSVNPDAQIITATHSPEVMAEIPDESIFELEV